MKTFKNFKAQADRVKNAVKEDEVLEDAPTNNAGSGNVAGLGVGPAGEPGVSPNYQRKRKQLGLMNGPAVDNRMFADKIFGHSKTAPQPGTGKKLA